jgi:hypothetical protein
MSILAVINHMNCKLKGNELRDVCFIWCYTVDKNLSMQGCFKRYMLPTSLKRLKRFMFLSENL